MERAATLIEISEQQERKMSALRCVYSCMVSRLEVMRAICRLEELSDELGQWCEWCGYDAVTLERIAAKIRARRTTRLPENGITGGADRKG